MVRIKVEKLNLDLRGLIATSNVLPKVINFIRPNIF